MNWQAHIRSALTRDTVAPDEDVVLELAQHAADAFVAARADGLALAEAEVHVRALVAAWCANPAGIRRRPARPGVLIPPSPSSRGWTGIAQDVRYGTRLLLRQPGFTAFAVVLIALGVGAATALATLTYSVLLAPLPWTHADRVVRLAESREGETRRFPDGMTNAVYLAWREAPATIDGIAFWGSGTMTMTRGTASSRLPYVTATASLFQVLEARPRLGTLFGEDDERDGRNHVIVISHGLWQRAFGGAPDAIGSSVDLNGDPYRVVAVMPPGFFFPDRETQAWMPRGVPAVLSANPTSRRVSVSSAVAKLKPGVSPEQASAEGTARGITAPQISA